MESTKNHNNTWIELSESAYAANLRFFRKIIGKRPELSVVVKANAYGHGWHSIASMAVKHGADSFCVHSLAEALQLRHAGFNQDILVMGHIPLSLLEAAVDEHLRIAVFNLETIHYLHEITERRHMEVRIHLKLETGTYRQGITIEALPEYLALLKQSQQIKLEGVYTHFADIEDTTNHDFAEYQRNGFFQHMQLIHEAGFSILKRHAACSAAALLIQDTQLDMVRLGIGQYGLWPSKETLVSYREKHNIKPSETLKPVLSWKTRVTQLKSVPADHTIGYGRSYKTTRETRIAVLPVGYADGYDRQISNQGHVLIRERIAPIRGRICMNLMMVDVTDIPQVALEDEVVLIGRQGKERISAEQLAQWSGTIHYEVVARINSAISRFVVVDEPENKDL